MKDTVSPGRESCAGTTKTAPTPGGWQSAAFNNSGNVPASPPRPTDMQKEADTWILSRRSVLALAGAGLVARQSLYASTDFWNKKDPSQWTGEQIDQLTSKS